MNAFQNMKKLSHFQIKKKVISIQTSSTIHCTGWTFFDASAMAALQRRAL